MVALAGREETNTQMRTYVECDTSEQQQIVHHTKLKMQTCIGQLKSMFGTQAF